MKIKGQMELFPEVRKLIYSQSLTCYKTICPYCKMDNPDSEHNRSWIYDSCYPYRKEPLDICPNCGGKYDRDNMEIRKSKDLIKLEQTSVI